MCMDIEKYGLLLDKMLPDFGPLNCIAHLTHDKAVYPDLENMRKFYIDALIIPPTIYVCMSMDTT